MSDNEPRPGIGRRILSQSEKDQEEIRDWMNGSGSLAIVGIVVFIVGFVIFRAVFL